MKRIMFICCVLVSLMASAQPAIKILESGKRVSIRGLSVVTDKIVWASGSNGSVARSVDGGNTWTWIAVPGYEKRDFRDIEGFDEDTAIIMAVAEPAIMLKTSDGGTSWRKVFEDTTKGMFLDAMDFGPNSGIVIGDPINNIAFEAITFDHGDTWKKVDHPARDSSAALSEGEAFFASSGTNVKLLGNHPVRVSGGKRSRIVGFWPIGSRVDLPIMQGKESTGANSIAVYFRPGSDGPVRAVVVGGDFSKDTISSNNCVLVTVRDEIGFSIPKTPPHGYRSCVIYLSKNNLLTCGTSGIDISKDGGENWELISKESFHVCQKAKKGTAVFLAGGGGRIAKLEGK
jgi:hypothetical protein